MEPPVVAAKLLSARSPVLLNLLKNLQKSAEDAERQLLNAFWLPENPTTEFGKRFQ